VHAAGRGGLDWTLKNAALSGSLIILFVNRYLSAKDETTFRDDFVTRPREDSMSLLEVHSLEEPSLEFNFAIGNDSLSNFVDYCHPSDEQQEVLSVLRAPIWSISDLLRQMEGGNRKRLRGESVQASDQGSSEDGASSNKLEGLPPQKYGDRKRQQISHFRRDSLQSLSMFHEWRDGNEVGDPSPSESSEKADDSSQLPRSKGPDSASELDWELFIREDSEILPYSNWEADFLEHQARIMDRSGYKGLLFSDSGLPDEGPN
jgi:hypothetical protein